MEPTPEITVPVQPPPVSSPRSLTPHVLVISILVVLALALAIGVGVYLWLHKASVGQDLFPKDSRVSIALGEGPIGAWFNLDAAARTLSPVITLNEQETPYVVDYVSVGDSTYALLTNAATSSLIMQTQNGTRSVLANSNTFKYGLSYDAQSGKFAYLTVPSLKHAGEVSDIVIFDPTSGKEQVVGQGTEATLLPGGTSVVAREHDHISIITSGVVVASLVAPSATPFAVSEDTSRIALYNPVSGAVDEFSLTANSFSYLSSYHSSYTPQALGYVLSNIVGFTQLKEGTLFAFGVGNLSQQGEAFASPVLRGLPRDIMTRNIK